MTDAAASRFAEAKASLPKMSEEDLAALTRLLRKWLAQAMD